MSRDYKVFIRDVLAAIRKIESYTKGLTKSKFKTNELIIDGVIRNLEIIGEAAKNIPPDIRDKHKNIEWNKISGLRDILIHEYFGVDIDILWNIIETKIPELKKAIKKVN